MKSNDFISSIPKDIFVFSGSYAIKKQIKDFRENKDIDIALLTEYSEFVQFKAEKLWAIVEINWQYDIETMQISFDDWSMIDCILWGELPKDIVVISNYKYFRVSEIAKHKVNLLSQYNSCNGGKILQKEKYEKHSNDLIFLLEKWHILLK